MVLANTESYTPDSLKGLQEARDAAKVLADAGEGNEEEMLQVLGTLDTLLGQVKNRADKTELVMALSKASSGQRSRVYKGKPESVLKKLSKMQRR